MFTARSEDVLFWPTSPGSRWAAMYRDYKKLINNIAERLRRSEVVALAYQYDLPMWFSEVGVAQEPGYALRVLSFMEGKRHISPNDLTSLAQSLELIGRDDLKQRIEEFQRKHSMEQSSICSPQAAGSHTIVPPIEETTGSHGNLQVPFSSPPPISPDIPTPATVSSIPAHYEYFNRTHDSRRSFEQHQRRIIRSSSDGNCLNILHTNYLHSQQPAAVMTCTCSYDINTCRIHARIESHQQLGGSNQAILHPWQTAPAVHSPHTGPVGHYATFSTSAGYHHYPQQVHSPGHYPHTTSGYIPNSHYVAGHVAVPMTSRDTTADLATSLPPKLDTQFDIETDSPSHAHNIRKQSSVTTPGTSIEVDMAKLALETTLMTADSLVKQIQYLHKHLGHTSTQLHETLTNAYFQAHQVSSSLKIATKNTTSIAEEEEYTRNRPPTNLEIFNEYSPSTSPHHSRNNSIRRHNDISSSHPHSSHPHSSHPHSSHPHSSHPHSSHPQSSHPHSSHPSHPHFSHITSPNEIEHSSSSSGHHSLLGSNNEEEIKNNTFQEEYDPNEEYFLVLSTKDIKGHAPLQKSLSASHMDVTQRKSKRQLFVVPSKNSSQGKSSKKVWMPHMLEVLFGLDKK